MKDNLHIAILKFGRTKLQEGITFDELETHLRESGYKVNKDRLKLYVFGAYETLNLADRGSSQKAAVRGVKLSLTMESTFRLIEFEEFRGANRSSRIAIWFATAALVVSIVSTVFSVVFSMKQLDSSSEIDQLQVDGILGATNREPPNE